MLEHEMEPLTQPKVRLVSHTIGVGPLEGHGPEDIVAYCARVSSPQNQENFNTAPKLLKYCWKNGHHSVFETCSLTFEITCPIAIATQILRHRSGTFQQFSGRYAHMTNYFQCEARRQDTKNRQNSIGDMSDGDIQWFNEAQKQVWDLAMTKYQEALDKGMAKEQARFLLPLNTSTTLYFTNNIRNFIHYVQLREAHGTQKEHAEIAKLIKQEMMRILPNISKALEWEA
jgi:thymidylate synthase (FAD)